MLRNKKLYAGFLMAGVILAASQTGLLSVLRSSVLMGRQTDGSYLVASNQLLRPWGRQSLIRGRPVDLAFDSGKRLLAVLNSNGVLLMDGSTGVQMAEVKTNTTSYTGLAFRPGDRELWASETGRTGGDAILIIPLSDTGRPGEPDRIKLPGHPVPAGIAFSPDGAMAYVALSLNNSVAVIDAAARKVTREVPVGMAPFSVVAAAKQSRLFVSNRAGRRPGAGDTVADSSGAKVVTDPVTGATASGTVSVIDLRDWSVREIAVGLAPASMSLSPDGSLLAVPNAHSDSLSLIDTARLSRTDLKIPAYPEGTLGSQPANTAFAPDGKTIYAACGGDNAVAVIKESGKTWEVAGAVPTGWFPSALAIDGEGGLRVVNIKGVGNTADGKGTFNARQYEGSLLRIPAPAPVQAASGMREVRAANSPVFEPAGGIANLASLGIKHLFLIIKENRTYDQVFGDMPKGNGDPRLVMYGRDITPNHHALAEKYVLLDNFYASGAISFEGHQWLMQAFVSDYVERALISAPRGYAWNMSDALTVSPAGFFWQGARRPLDVRLYGVFSLPSKWDSETNRAVDIDEGSLLSWSEYWRLYKEGKWRDAVGSRSGVPALAKLANTRFPVSSMHIPDQLRADSLLEDLARLEKAGRVPNLSLITMTSDHTMGTRPGSPTPAAMVADNDLALGRIVEGITNSSYWPRTLILVVEDDAQNGVDHVDGHRTVALAIGPHIRRGALDSNHYTQISMVRTIQEIFGIPPRTRFLKTARPMSSVFTADADLSTYRAITPEIPLDTMNPPLKALRGRQLQAARQSLAMNWHEVDDVPQDVLNRILWGESKGFERPYPVR